MLALPFAVEPKMILSSVMPSPQVLLLLERTNSNCEPSGRKRKMPCPNRMSLPPTVPRKPE